MRRRRKGSQRSKSRFKMAKSKISYLFLMVSEIEKKCERTILTEVTFYLFLGQLMYRYKIYKRCEKFKRYILKNCKCIASRKGHTLPLFSYAKFKHSKTND